MKLLFDQNLSPRLSRSLADLFPKSAHVRDIGLRDAPIEIWAYAKLHGFVIITKDTDFEEWHLLSGWPPKVIWIAIGNSKVDEIEALIRHHSATIQTFFQDPEKGYQVLRSGGNPSEGSAPV